MAGSHVWTAENNILAQSCINCKRPRIPFGRQATSRVMLEAEESICPAPNATPAPRSTWDETWMAVADVMAKRSLCVGRQVGAVIVDAKNRIVATGYNGPPANFDTRGELCSSWCKRQIEREEGLDMTYGLSCPTVHAELNALVFADRRHYEGGTLYVTAACCADCGKVIANSGVSRVVMRLDERDMHRNPHDTIEFIRSCGIDVRAV